MRFSLKSTHRLRRDPGFGNRGLKKTRPGMSIPGLRSVLGSVRELAGFTRVSRMALLRNCQLAAGGCKGTPYRYDHRSASCPNSQQLHSRRPVHKNFSTHSCIAGAAAWDKPRSRYSVILRPQLASSLARPPKSANGLGQQARLSSTVNALTQIAPERASAKSRKPVQPRQTAGFAGQRQ